MFDSGIDIQKCLAILVDEQKNKKTKEVIQQIINRVIAGSSLSEALAQSNHFTPYEYQSIRIGEESGKLTPILFHMGEFYTKKIKLRRQMIGVFTYPTIVICITIGVLYFMLNSVVPMFEDVFKQFGQELPSLTQKIIWLSANFTTFFGIFLGSLIGLFIYGYTQRKEPKFRKITSTLVLKLPVFGKLIERIYMARMCQSMALLLQAKTPLVKSLEMVKEMIGFYPIEEALDEVKKNVMKGEALYQGLNKFPIFESRLISLVKIAEEINQLETTFERLANQYQEDIDYRSKLIGTIIEPLIIVLIGLIVGVIMVSMYLPMFNLSNVVK
jgi:type IV pilus assembly protein PilC